MKTAIDSQIIKSLSDLGTGDKNRVLAYIKSMLRERSGSKLLRFAGSFDKKDLAAMESAIARGCENIDGDEW